MASLVSLCDGFDAEAVLGSDVPADLIDDWFADEVVCASFGLAPYAWWSIKAERSTFFFVM